MLVNLLFSAIFPQKVETYEKVLVKSVGDMARPKLAANLSRSAYKRAKTDSSKFDGAR